MPRYFAVGKPILAGEVKNSTDQSDVYVNRKHYATEAIVNQANREGNLKLFTSYKEACDYATPIFTQEKN